MRRHAPTMVSAVAVALIATGCAGLAPSGDPSGSGSPVAATSAPPSLPATASPPAALPPGPQPTVTGAPSCVPAPVPQLDTLPQRPELLETHPAGQAVATLQVEGDQVVGVAQRDGDASEFAAIAQVWRRLASVVPARYRGQLDAVFLLAGGSDEDGLYTLIPVTGTAGDIGDKGEAIGLSPEQALGMPDDPCAELNPRRDWVLLHEFFHLFVGADPDDVGVRFDDAFAAESSAAFGDGSGDTVVDDQLLFVDLRQQPVDGQVFVTRYAAQNAEDNVVEEVMETVVAYMLIDEVPRDDSLVSRKLRFFDQLDGFPQLRGDLRRVGVVNL